MLKPGKSAGNYVWYDLYSVDGTSVDISGWTSQKIIWNIYTSPDVIVGAAVLPEDITAYTMSIDQGSIVPYVKVNHQSGITGSLGRVDFYFAKSGDLTTLVALGDTTVYVYLNGSTTPDHQFTNFNKAVRNSFYLNCAESAFTSMKVEYIKDGAKYIWNFTPSYQNSTSAVNLGDFVLSKMPYKLEASTSKDFKITIPGIYDLSSYFTESGDPSDLISVGDVNVLEVESLSLDQGSAYWDGTTWNEKNSTLSFTLLGLQSGRATLRINIPGVAAYLREVNVTSNGKLVLSGNVPAGVSMQVSGHTTRATFANGKSWYPSAEDYEDTYSFVLSGNDFPDSGYFGMTYRLTYGDVSELHSMSADQQSGSSRKYTINNGAYINTEVYYEAGQDEDAITSDNYTLNISDDVIEKAFVWAEFPDNPSFNVVSASLKSIIVPSDYRTTAEQLTDFVPYFNMYALNGTNNTVSMDWSFVNPNTMAQVTAGISNVKINGSSVKGTSGTISGMNYGSVKFQYDYNGITYTWNFDEMARVTNYATLDIPKNYFTTGQSLNVGIYLYSNAPNQITSIDMSIWDTDILSADPVSSGAVNFSCSVYAVKEGSTRITLVFTRAAGEYTSLYDRYVQNYKSFSVVNPTTTVMLNNEPFTASFYASDDLGSGAIVEGSTLDYDLSKNYPDIEAVPRWYCIIRLLHCKYSGTRIIRISAFIRRKQ